MSKQSDIVAALSLADYAAAYIGFGCEMKWDEACKRLRKDHGSAWKGIAAESFYKGYANISTIDGICTNGVGSIIATMVGAEVRTRNYDKMPPNWREVFERAKEAHYA